MDISSKLQILADAAKYDAACASSESVRQRTAGGIGNAALFGMLVEDLRLAKRAAEI